MLVCDARITATSGCCAASSGTPALPAAAIGEELLREFDAFLGGEGPGDDVTLIVMKVL